MKKVVFVGIFVLGSSLLEAHAMNRLTLFVNKVFFGHRLMHVYEMNGTYRGISGGNGEFSSWVKSVQRENNEELSVQFSGTELAEKGDHSLVPLKFFDNSKAKFRKQLAKSAQRVADGFSELNTLSKLDEEERESQKLLTVINEFETLNVFCKDEFDKNREKVNEVFLQALVARTKDIMQNEIEQKEAEIIRLQGRLDELLKKSSQTAESLGSFDKIIQKAEEDVRTTKEETENFVVPELVKEEQIDRTFARFSKKLENIQNEVQKGKEDLEKILKEVFEKTQEQYEDSTNILIENLGDRYEDIMANVEERYKDQKKHLAKAYDRQISIMNEKINKFIALNAQLENEKELQSLINSVYRSNPDDAFIRSHSFISGNAQEIRDIWDLPTRRGRVEGIYNKVRLFSELLGREDLGVEAKPSDLKAVKSWLDKTSEDNILARYSITFAHKEKEFTGTEMSGQLLHEKTRLESQIMSVDSVEAKRMIELIQTIFQRSPAANDRVTITWEHPTFWGHYTDKICYFRNGVEEGQYFKEHGGGWWESVSGFLGNMSGKAAFYRTSWDDLGYVWSHYFLSRFNTHFKSTTDAIKQQATNLFDFETNPDSPLQRLYQESEQTNSSIIDFPSAEIDALVEQCNEFIKKIV